MDHEETVRLLRECNAGIKMGIYAFDQLLPGVKSTRLADLLVHSRAEHDRLGDETHAMLVHYGDPAKDPGALAKGMAKMRTGMRLFASHQDETIADMLTDGCHMGIKSLSRYLNQYPQAEACARQLTGRIIQAEQQLAEGLRMYL